MNQDVIRPSVNMKDIYFWQEFYFRWGNNYVSKDIIIQNLIRALKLENQKLVSEVKVLKKRSQRNDLLRSKYELLLSSSDTLGEYRNVEGEEKYKTFKLKDAMASHFKNDKIENTNVKKKKSNEHSQNNNFDENEKDFAISNNEIDSPSQIERNVNNVNNNEQQNSNGDISFLKEKPTKEPHQRSRLLTLFRKPLVENTNELQANEEFLSDSDESSEDSSEKTTKERISYDYNNYYFNYSTPNVNSDDKFPSGQEEGRSSLTKSDNPISYKSENEEKSNSNSNIEKTWKNISPKKEEVKTPTKIGRNRNFSNEKISFYNTSPSPINTFQKISLMGTPGERNIYKKEDSRTEIFSEIQTPTFKRPKWVPDNYQKSCKNCKSQFTTTLRRHHCRSCNFLFIFIYFLFIFLNLK